MAEPIATAIHGFCDRAFLPLQEAFAANFADGLEVGASLAATWRGKPVVDLWAGHADRKGLEPWREDTVVAVFSSTKIPTILCTLIVVSPRVLALIFSIAISFGHTIGSGSWLFEHFELGYQLANAYYLLSACALGLGIHYAIGSGGPEHEVLKVPAQVRVKLGGAAFALGMLLWVYPWQA